MVLTGYARLVRGDLAPEQIVDPALVALGDPAEIAAACLTTVDATLAERVREGDLLVLDGALLDGAGAEAAVIGLQAVGFAAVICRGAAEALLAVSAIYGLPLLAVAEAAGTLADGELIRLDLERGTIEAAGTRWVATALEAPALAAVRRAQLLARMRRVVEDEGYAEG